MGTIFARPKASPIEQEQGPKDFAQKQAAREIPRRMPGLIAAECRESRRNGLKTGQKGGIWTGMGERRVENDE
jgi:hypothetical protein